MCGILGSGSTKKLDYNKIKKALDSISHRGPDGSGHYVSDNQKVYFGHRRLSIIDLSRNADQPMIDNNMNVLTFNGEIYNYTELKK
jgi:asparagine synthase (glutamine-hydrolysing)